jgi:hypothetical protein
MPFLKYYWNHAADTKREIKKSGDKREGHLALRNFEASEKLFE